MQHTLRLFKQTLHPPKRTIPLASNPLTRWSRRVPQWQQLAGTLTRAEVGLEGCHSAFNATNSIRTCLFFQTSAPPTFLTAASWKSIEHMQTRTHLVKGVDGSSKMAIAAPADDNPFAGLASFGESAFFSSVGTPSHSGEIDGVYRPTVAVENFTDRAKSLLQTRLPFAAKENRSDGKNNCIRLVVGHENWGVRRSLLRSKGTAGVAASEDDDLPVADFVVYVPQYGTISSLNVVTSLGIALFYCYLDEHYPASRVIYDSTPYRDRRKQGSPTERKEAAEAELSALREQIQMYQDYFKQSLPTPFDSTTSSLSPLSSERDLTLSRCATETALDAHVNTTPRIDKRPIHPVFYKQEMNNIQQQQQNYRRMLLQYSHGTPLLPLADLEKNTRGEGNDESDVYSEASNKEESKALDCAQKPAFFGMSVLYENEYDQRNFGGLIRNANAFFVDHILYVGRRKYNVVGAVGSYHYTPPVYLGPLPNSSRGHSAARQADVGSNQSALDPNKDTNASEDEDERENDQRKEDWSLSLRAKVELLYGVESGSAIASARAWWLLDCGHGFLYEDGSDVEAQGGAAQASAATTPTAESSVGGNPGVKDFATSSASLRLYKALLTEGKVRNLCEPEPALRAALAGGVVLIVPQEGKLPHRDIMRLCTGVLTILPQGAHHASNCTDSDVGSDGTKRANRLGHRGLPSQVASGIALQRLSAVLHPRLAAI